MLETGVLGGSEPPAATSTGGATVVDRSMQVLEYVVALIAMIAAVVLAFVH